MAIKVSRVTKQKPKAPAKGAVAVATGSTEGRGQSVPAGTSTDAVAALVGRYKARRKGGGKGCCPGKKGY